MFNNSSSNNQTLGGEEYPLAVQNLVYNVLNYSGPVHMRWASPVRWADSPRWDNFQAVFIWEILSQAPGAAIIAFA